jgi:hypothetical protein
VPSSSGVGVVAGLLEVALGELVGVDDEHAVRLEVLEVGLERRRVHRHQHVGRVAGRVDVVVEKCTWKALTPGEGAGGRADLGGEVRQRREVVADAAPTVLVNWSPVSCMPSPESPAKRMTTATC